MYACMYVCMYVPVCMCVCLYVYECVPCHAYNSGILQHSLKNVTPFDTIHWCVFACVYLFIYSNGRSAYGFQCIPVDLH